MIPPKLLSIGIMQQGTVPWSTIAEIVMTVQLPVTLADGVS
jgi:hypothetical protein